MDKIKKERTLRWWTLNYYLYKYLVPVMFVGLILINNPEWDYWQRLLVLICLLGGTYKFWIVSDIRESED